MRVVHLTPFGPGRALSRRECRAAHALVAESIRIRLTEYRARHLFARRPTQCAVLGQRFVARRRTLLVVSDGTLSKTKILFAATARASTPKRGTVARLGYSVARRLTRRVVMAITMLVVLAAYDGHTALSALITSGIIVAIVSSPLLTSVRVRCGDRALAARAARFLPERSDELQGVVVLHDFGLPCALGAPEGTSVDFTTVGAALSRGTIPTCIAQPCCLEAGELFATWSGAILVPQHAQPERTILVFPIASDNAEEAPAGHEDGQIVAIDRGVLSRRGSFEFSIF